MKRQNTKTHSFNPPSQERHKLLDHPSSHYTHFCERTCKQQAQKKAAAREHWQKSKIYQCPITSNSTNLFKRLAKFALANLLEPIHLKDVFEGRPLCHYSWCPPTLKHEILLVQYRANVCTCHTHQSVSVTWEFLLFTLSKLSKFSCHSQFLLTDHYVHFHYSIRTDGKKNIK